jgi:flagellar capping protein FliD
MQLADNFTAYTQWRAELTTQIERFRRWLSDNDLNDPQTDQRLSNLTARLREDRLTVAFVAEFSRGKSELINSIFFAEYGNRMLPSSAGRTTMCPTELMYDKAKLPCIELLPIETRNTNAGIAEYKKFPDEWKIFPLEMTSAQDLQSALKHVSETIRVQPDAARQLGFAVDSEKDTSLHVGEDGLVEVPRWRHAVINFPHPLLMQGLVILDTPGLNAIGTEPELTLSLLPSAHAVLFILAADTGVTQSDLTIWREHIGAPEGMRRGRLVVLNKIDSMWDELKTLPEIEAEINKQIKSCATILDLPTKQIFPVSAQKGLVAKINQDAELLKRTRLLELEQAMATELVPAKQDIVRDSTMAEFTDIQGTVQHVLDVRLADIREQLKELADLRGKNKGVVEYMMGKVKSEKDEFEVALQRYYAVRSVFTSLTNKLFGHLGLEILRGLTRTTREKMQGSNFTMGLSGSMHGYFATLRNNLAEASKEVAEIMMMMEAIYKKFRIEHGLKLGTPTAFSLLRYEKELARLERWCNVNLNTPMHLLTLEKRVVTQRFFEEVAVQIRKTFEHANRDAEIWLKAIMAPMEAQVREHQMQLKRRLESIKRIHQATDTLEDRIAELNHSQNSLDSQIASMRQVAQQVEERLKAAGFVQERRRMAAA